MKNVLLPPPPAHRGLKVCFAALAMLLLLFFCAALPATAQFFPSNSGMKSRFDSSIAQLPICGATASYFKSLAVDTSQGGTALRASGASAPSDFPAGAIVRCGKFELYYEDLLPINSFGGFGDLVVGAARRNTFCAVLNYIQSVVDFSNISSSAPVRILVEKSYSGWNPAPVGTGGFAKAGPYYFNAAASPVGGYVRDYIVSGIDPAPGKYHGVLMVNFDKFWPSALSNYPTLINWHNDHTTPVASCEMDLYSTILHECTHILGWYSLLDYTPSNSISPNDMFTYLDNSIHLGAGNTNLGTTNALPLTKLIVNNVINVAYRPNGTMWLNGSAPPENIPVYSGEAPGGWTEPIYKSYISHLDEQSWAWHSRNRLSPGEHFPYVMGPFGIRGISKREYTKHEAKALQSILGYSYVHTYSLNNVLTLNNRVPYSLKMQRYDINDYFQHMNYSPMPDSITPDYVINNDVGSSIIIDVNSDPDHFDPDGDVMTVMPGTLINYRGCGSGGNNHNQLTVSQNGKVITFKPRPNFLGIAQFGFTLWDGKEKGTFILYTIQVNAGTNVVPPANGELVLNGDFEEGTEVKRYGQDETIYNTSAIEHNYIGKLLGAHFADSHPLDYFSNAWYPAGGGIIINNALRPCGNAFLPNTVYEYGYKGNATKSTNNPPYHGLNLPPVDSINGERYQAITTSGPVIFKLISPMQSCQNYILEFDAYFGQAPIVKIGFTTEGFANLRNLDYAASRTPATLHEITAINATGTGMGLWSHIVIRFAYCNAPATDIMALFLQERDYMSYPICIDNVSLKVDLPPVCGLTRPCFILRDSAATTSANVMPATASALLNYFGNPPSNTISTNVPIIIDGNFKVDHDIIFGGGDIRFANPANAAAFCGMTVEPGKTLTIRDAQLKAACGYLWNGIAVPATAGGIDIGGSTISGMKEGIIVNGNVPVSFTGNQFKDNYYNLKFYDNDFSHSIAINGNTFITSSSLLLPPYAGKKSKAGVYAYNCRKLIVGPNGAGTSGAGNSFDNLNTGIYIDADAGPAVGTGATYRIYNNDFKNITGGLYGTVVRTTNPGTSFFADLFTDPEGTAVFARNNLNFINSPCRLHIDYFDGSTAKIQNCSKAVTVYNFSLDAHKVKIQDGTWGFSIGRPEYSTYNLWENQMTNTHRGISISGTANRTVIRQNIFSSPLNGNAWFNNVSIGNPVGISLSNASPLNTNSATLEENTIAINSLGGTGIVLQNTGKGVVVNKNTLNLLTSQWGTNSGTSNPLLAGVSLNNCNNSILQNNQVNGNNNFANPANNPTITTQRTNVAGFYIDRSPGLVIKTNQTVNLKYGFLVLDKCVTAKNAVAGNCFLNHQYGMLFRQVVGNPGTLGDLGDPKTDNNNRFNGYFYALQGGQKMKVYTMVTNCNGYPQPAIYTRTNPPNFNGTINANESGSNVAGCHYRIIPNGSPITVLPACVAGPVIRWPDDRLPALRMYDTAGSIAVAQDSVVYPYFADVAKWMADKDLYEILSQDADARAADPELDLFYTQKEATLFKNLQNADSILAGMSDSAIWNDRTTWEQWLAGAKGENNGIVSADVQEENENRINDAYMRYLEGGFDTLNNEDDSTLIASLALSCPYVNGSAVYKARMLYSYWAPAETYTDLEICNSVGLYKGGVNPLEAENEWLNSFSFPGPDGETSPLNRAGQALTISPNPGTGIFKVEVVGRDLDKGLLEVYNVLGQKVTAMALGAGVNTLNLTGKPSGLYYYRWQAGSRTLQSGKIVLNP